MDDRQNDAAAPAFDVAAYLRRIDYQGSTQPTLETLKALHKAHLLTVPFENLDIHRGQPILLDEARFFDKIVSRRRGGFCYEANGLFAALLNRMGFNVTMLSARVANGQGGFGPEFDHMALLVQLEQRWLADVGFGDSFREPLLLDEHEDQPQDGRVYRLTREGALWKLAHSEGSTWNDDYIFTLQPRRLADFAGMCRYHQTSPDSTFTRRRICSLATPEGRISLSDMRLIVTTAGERQERLLATEQEYDEMLLKHFGVTLGQ